MGGTVATVTTDVWIHVVAVYNGANLLVYIDGVLDDTQPAQTGAIGQSQTLRDIRLSGVGASEGDMAGEIDEVYFYNRALQPNEIQQHLVYPLALLRRRRALGLVSVPAAGGATIPRMMSLYRNAGAL